MLQRRGQLGQQPRLPHALVRPRSRGPQCHSIGTSGPLMAGAEGRLADPLDPPPAADPSSIISACMPDAALHNNNNLLFSASLERVRHLASAHCLLWGVGVGGALHTSKGNVGRQCIQTKIIRKALHMRLGNGEGTAHKAGNSAGKALQEKAKPSVKRRDCTREQGEGMGERRCKTVCRKQDNSV